MAESKHLPEFRMAKEIRRRIKDAKVSLDRSARIDTALSAAQKRDPSSFGSDESRAIVVQDIADTYIERYKKRQKKTEDREAAPGEWLPYPTGYEYAVLAAARLNPLIKLVREAWFIPNAQPFETFDGAVAWMNAHYEKDLSEQQARTGVSTVSFDLPADKAEKLRLLLIQNISSENKSTEEGATTPQPVALYTDEIIDALPEIFDEALLDNFRIEDQPADVLTLFPIDDYKEKHGVSWSVILGGNTAIISDYCRNGVIKSRVPEWTANMLFSYVVLGRLPLLPLSCEVDVAGPGVFKHTLTIRYPMRDETLLNFYRGSRNTRNDSSSRHYNFDPPALSEYNLVLLELVHKMPLEDFTWSQRLEQYRKQYARQIDLGFLGDLGLPEPHNMISQKRWNTAAGNLSRDYKSVLKKLK